MLRLVMEAVMILAIVGGMVFITKISASENNTPRRIEDDISDGSDSDTKQTDSM